MAIWVSRYLNDLNEEQDATLPTECREEYFRFLANDLANDEPCLDLF